MPALWWHDGVRAATKRVRERRREEEGGREEA